MRLLAALLAIAAAVAGETAPFTLPPLPYPADALEPAIDAETMRIHHGRHHQAYVDNLNKAVAAEPRLAGMDLEAMLGQVSSLPPSIRNHGGGHYNHALFWSLMTRPGAGGEPSPALAARLAQDFGSVDAFKAAFAEAGAKRFGSGWAWLVWSDGKLAVTSTANQDNPLMDVVPVRGQPILAVDVWEHAYYLRYQHRRGDYLAAWWQVVDWRAASGRFAAATAVRP